MDTLENTANRTSDTTVKHHVEKGATTEIKNSFVSTTMLRKTQRKTVPVVELSYEDFFNKNVMLKKYKLPELKSLVKQHKLPVTGSKPILIERLETHFKKMKCAKKIQQIYRGWIVRYSFLLRGEAFKNRGICVNDSDFVTLEPLVEIPFEQFYSYKDDKNFVYGFNVLSLIELMKKKGKLSNPYNREKLDFKTMNDILSLNNIIHIVFHEYKNTTSQPVIQLERPQTSPVIRNQQLTSTIIPMLSNSYYFPTITTVSPINPSNTSKYNRILECRIKPTAVRIQELFIEIDQLGNYTQNSWFADLQRNDYVRLYRVLFDIWNYRGQLSREIKMKICMFFDPFVNIFIRSIYHNDINLEQIQFVCLTILENFIYTGVDDDHRKIGALHVLSALTIVSPRARQSMPWLYESIAY